MKITRKRALKNLSGLATLGFMGLPTASSGSNPIAPLSQRINHSVCEWCFNQFELEELCEFAKSIGISSIDLLTSEQWATAQKYDLTCAMAYGSQMGIVNGFSDPQNHKNLLKEYKDSFPKAADAGLVNVICFSGNRNGLSDAAGLEICAKGLEPVVKLAEKHNIVLTMELLNSKVDHQDYLCDHTEWGVALTDKLGSSNFKLLYDIYHMQIMEGDVIATIQKRKDYISHYHTAGVPGRNEIDETQELYYPAIMKAIADTGFTGHVAQEFIPKQQDALASLKKGIEICDI
ncbi:TIM barrel protein [Cyclobacteriaceae bacterium]|jgi:hydroxypyruvate isomerase|nr:TIM barrel protein [Cyclobacteriaceae bacterium]MDB4012596.1 TIM barrel protein [Cyclobacteriaceae bacterium]MDC1234421.1 TIM barrel protein [Cyclobacteriaceae bacterium]MDC1516355.1 TIM barrel protein [Cyclobacteriaceae bacterium]|tara:strand:+ start:129 stop:998 length:870 start_codon:yes stop_codon:yes gene_type:complete